MKAEILSEPVKSGVLRKTPLYTLHFSVLGVLLLALFIAELCIGVVAVPLRAVLEVVFTGTTDNVVWYNIIMEFRLPRVLTALFAGAALGGAGLMLQTLFRNPLADPYVLGVMHGAALGVAAVVAMTGVVGNAFLLEMGLVGHIRHAIAAVLGTMLVLFILERASRRVSTVTLLVVGLMLGYLAVGLTSLLLHFVDLSQYRTFAAWNNASFAGGTQQQLKVLVPVAVLGLAGIWMLAKPLNALLLGERYAQSLGVPVVAVKRLALLATACLTGVVAAFCGPIAFLGLVAAQIARGLFQTAEHRVLLPAVILIGACVALAADLVMHLPWSRHVFHLNPVIALVGAPIALYVLFRSRSMRALE